MQSVISESSDSTRRIIRRVKMIVRQFAIAQHCHYHSCILYNLAQNAHFATLRSPLQLLCHFRCTRTSVFASLPGESNLMTINLIIVIKLIEMSNSLFFLFVLLYVAISTLSHATRLLVIINRCDAKCDG